MEVEYHIPTPKTLRKTCTCDDRLRIETLYFDANFTVSDICLQLNLKPGQVYYALSHRLTPQKRGCGRHVLLNTPQRKRLVEFVTTSSANRYIPWCDLPKHLGFNCGEKAIRKAFKTEGFVRCFARRKPPLTEQHKQDRLD
jgi:hypothetical protein